MPPLSLAGVVFDQPDVRITEIAADVPENVHDELASALHDLASRAALLAQPPAWDVLRNADFEESAGSGDVPPGWGFEGDAGAAAAADAVPSAAGRGCARLVSRQEAAVLASKPFKPPATGRLLVSAWLRRADDGTEALLRIGLAGHCRDRRKSSDWYRCGTFGAGSQEGQAIDGEWREYLVEFEDIPAGDLEDLSLQFELEGHGEIWIDEIRLYHLAFSPAQRRELAVDIHLAELQLRDGELAGCQRYLESYWARFLKAHVPLAPETAAHDTSDRVEPAGDDASPRVLDRLRKALPEVMR
jgi:hypothetical protein